LEYPGERRAVRGIAAAHSAGAHFPFLLLSHLPSTLQDRPAAELMRELICMAVMAYLGVEAAMAELGEDPTVLGG
jgi:hypothetical protein